MPGQITAENVDRTFGSVELDDTQKALVNKVTTLFTEVAREVILNVPASAHRSAALRHLLEAKWTCVDAIAKGGEV
jgi:3-dehydroquinate dehydratase